MKKVILISALSFLFFSCTKDKTYTPYEIDTPSHFPEMIIPVDNPMTVEGIELGRKLFYDTRLSLDNSIACASCHRQENGFSDPNQFSRGVGDSIGNRNSMALMNLGWQPFFFWDGRAASLEEQILGPVENPIEMHLKWDEAVKRISDIKSYRESFRQVFQTKTISKELVSKAIAQFLRTLISANSKYDVMYKYANGLTLNTAENTILTQITPDEWAGYNTFKDLNGADCFHCHNGPLMQVNKFSNNGLDAVPADIGRENVTKLSSDRGKFKVPSLRNIALTAPYMHDGRFKTLDEVIEQYSSGIHQSATIDPLIQFAFQGGVQLDAQKKKELKAFLNTLTDFEFVTNPKFAKP